VLCKDLLTAKTGYWIVRVAFTSSFALVSPAQAQSVISYSSVIFGVMSDSGDLRESMRREHRERVERGLAGNPDRPAQSNAGQPDQVNGGDPREAENAARRARWQRMSPEEREQMRRDIHQAGRVIYPQNPSREGP